MNYEARFGGIGRLYGNSGLSLLRSARIAVVIALCAGASVLTIKRIK